MKLIKVMLVDSENEILDNLKSIIPWRKNGFEIVAKTTVSNDALDLYKSHRPEIVITDIWMPGLNGLDLSKKILSIDNLTKIIFLTSYKDIEFAKFTISLGASNYLLKHELSKNKLLNELNILRNLIEKENKRKRISKRYLLKSLMANSFDLVYGNELQYLYDSNKNNLFSIFLLKIDS
ncbi:MAG: response regulator, partial [Clostridiales bacterium]